MHSTQLGMVMCDVFSAGLCVCISFDYNNWRMKSPHWTVGNTFFDRKIGSFSRVNSGVKHFTLNDCTAVMCWEMWFSAFLVGWAFFELLVISIQQHGKLLTHLNEVTHNQWCIGGYTRVYAVYQPPGFFGQHILTSVIINKQGTFRPFATPLCVYPPPFLAIHHCSQPIISWQMLQVLGWWQHVHTSTTS